MSRVIVIAELVLLKAVREKLLQAVFLLLLPFLVAAWVFEVNNSGFQTGFAVDMGGTILALFAALMLVVISSDQYLWREGNSTAGFYLSRIGKRDIYLLGKYAGALAVIFIGLASASLALAMVSYAATGAWAWMIFSAAFMVFCEFAVLAAVLAALSIIAGRLAVIGGMVLVYAAGISLEFIRMIIDRCNSAVFTGICEIFLVFVPDFSLFHHARMFDMQMHERLMVVFYALLMIGIYLLLALMFLRRRDL
jgi:hypothetical protein